MFSLRNTETLTRVRPTSNKMNSAAAIAVVSAVNPDKPGAFLFAPPTSRGLSAGSLIQISFLFLLLCCLTSLSFAATPAFHARNAMNNAIDQNSRIEVTPMLFHHIELGMTYGAVVNRVGKVPLYCDSGVSTCNAHNGLLSESCLRTEFIEPNSTWVCHWTGAQKEPTSLPSLQVWFVGDRVANVSATMENGDRYHRDSGNTIHFQKAPKA